ncbi:hypothetical protein VTN00DRAFT_5783 [Thermoascus crustaceus]|uniref:uncharacterized protein n=1 Tax=Thermoascus crustaceus TaxID=5088 RepID=UPI003744A3A5
MESVPAALAVPRQEKWSRASHKLETGQMIALLLMLPLRSLHRYFVLLRLHAALTLPSKRKRRAAPLQSADLGVQKRTGPSDTESSCREEGKAKPMLACRSRNTSCEGKEGPAILKQTGDKGCCSDTSKIQASVTEALETCCKESSESECECSAFHPTDECIIEYAIKLCEDEHNNEDEKCCSDGQDATPRAVSNDKDSLCTARAYSRPMAGNNEMINLKTGTPMDRSSLDQKANSILRQRRAVPCGQHLEMTSAYASGRSWNSRDAVATAEAQYVSNISNIIQKCFCKGPRPLLFPGQRTCCIVRRERKSDLNLGTRPYLSSPQHPIQKRCETTLPPEANVDIEKGSVGHKYTLSLGIVEMTCTGCEAKVRNILNSFAGVSDIISKIKKLAGFKCTVLKTGLAGAEANGESFVLKNLDANADTLVQALEGVDSVVPLGDHGHQVFYRPQIIGIRDILRAANSCGAQVKLSTDYSVTLTKSAEDLHWYWLTGRMAASIIFTIPVLVFAWSPFVATAPPFERMRYSAASMALATIVQMLSFPIYKHAAQVLIYQREIDMDVLVVLSITSAYVYSVVAFGFEIRSGGRFDTLGHPIFETSSLLITLILIGRVLTLWIRRRAKNVENLGACQSKTAHVVKKASPSEPQKVCADVKEPSTETMDVALLHYGDIIRAEGSDQIVTGGVVVSGAAEVDESHITGENEPVSRSKKAHVSAGSVIINGSIDYRVTRLISENTLSIVRRIVSTAASSRTKTQERADLVASYLTPIILAVACVTFLIWVLVNLLVRRLDSTAASIDALTYAISVLAISCPCALALAVPMVLTVASSVGVRKGVLFQTGAALDAGNKIGHVVFDKTGTLTTGQLSVLTEIILDEGSGFTAQEICQMTGTVTRGNKHPVSMAVNHHIESYTLIHDYMKNAVTANIVVGKGVEAVTANYTIRGGRPSLGVQDAPAVKEIVASSLTVFCVTRGDRLLAVYGLSSVIRPESADVLRKLRNMRITPHLLSGDHPRVVSRVAEELGFVDQNNVQNMCQPNDKAAYIRSLQKTTSGKVLFVGDGTNDAPALSQADIGICMRNATDIAADSADIGILSGSLNGVLVFLELSKRATRRIRLNLAWAMIYNLFAVLLAAGVFEAVRFRIPPSYAGVGEMVSLLPVIGISLSLNYWLLE